MTLFNERIKDIDFEISELNQQIKKLELEQKNMKERNAEVDKALKILGKVVEDYRSDEEVIFDLKHALSAMFLTPEELDRIANSQGSEFHPDAIAEYERNSYQSEAVEVGASEVEPKPEPQPKPEPNSEETQSDEPEKKSEPESKMSASGSVILNEKPAVFWDNGKTLRMFLETKPDAITTFEKAQAEGITDYHEIHQCGGDYILVLGNIDTREKANKVLEIWLEDEAKDMAEQEEQLTGIETLIYHNFDSSESAQKFGEEALTKGLCSRFDVEGCNITFYDASEKAIDRLLESEPEQPKDNKNWLNQSAFIYKGSATVNIGFKLKKTRDMWAKYFELVHPNCKLEKQEFSYISNCKRELAVTCYDIGETAYGDEFLEKIKRWDFSLSPDENRDREREPEPTPEPVQMSIKLANNATFHPSYQQLVMDFDTVELCESLGNHAVKDWLCNEFSVLTKEGFYRLQLKEVQTLENAEAIIALAKSAPAEIQPEIESGVDTNPPEPEPAGDDNDAEFLTENMAQNSSQPFQIPPKTKEVEPNDVSFHFQSQGKGVWLVFAIANGEKTQLAGVMQVGSYYRVPNLNNTDFGTLESAAKALWEHHQQRQKVFINF